MSTTVETNQPRAKIAGGTSLLAMVMGIASMSLPANFRHAAYLCAIVFNVATTLLFYRLLKPVNRIASLTAALLGLLVSIAGLLEWHPRGVDIGLVALGLYCLLVGGLVSRSTFLPRILGVLIAVGGVCWLSALYAPMAQRLFPYNLAGGALGQGALTLWLLFMGVNIKAWKQETGQAQKA